MTIPDPTCSASPIQWLVARVAATGFVRQALADNADLSAFKGKPTPRVILGVAAIAISYVLGWPAVALLGFLAAYYGRAAIVVVGGPLIYGFSHLVFLLGMYLAGAQYSWIFLRWLTRVTMLKLLKRYPCAAPPME